MRLTRRTLPDWNAVRYDPAAAHGHVESYFLKANDPAGRRALWIKATVFATDARPAGAIAEAWAVLFDRDTGHIAVKQSVPWAEASFSREGLGIQIGSLLRLEPGATEGAIDYVDHSVRWELTTAGSEPPLAALPWRSMYTGAFPKIKLVSPQPDLVVHGQLNVDGRQISVEGWRGMQGHNWGRGHAHLYAWGHCNQWDQGDGDLVIEAMSAKVKAGPVTSPMITLVCVRHRGVRYDLTAPMNILRNRGELREGRWRFEARNAQVRVEGEFSAPSTDFVGLYYPNPDGTMTYCLNTKLATGRVRFEVPGRRAMDWITRTAAFEIGTRDPTHGIRMYV